MTMQFYFIPKTTITTPVCLLLTKFLLVIPMQLSQQAIDQFKRIYFLKFQKQLSDEEANKKGVELLKFFKLVYKPIPKNFDGSVN